MLPWRNWQRKGLLIPGLRVRLPLGAPFAVEFWYELASIRPNGCGDGMLYGRHQEAQESCGFRKAEWVSYESRLERTVQVRTPVD